MQHEGGQGAVVNKFTGVPLLSPVYDFCVLYYQDFSYSNDLKGNESSLTDHIVSQCVPLPEVTPSNSVFGHVPLNSSCNTTHPSQYAAEHWPG